MSSLTWKERQREQRIIETVEDSLDERISTLEKTVEELTVRVNRVVEFARENGGLVEEKEA